jgi:phytoene dehydrogenase-like protein
VKDLELKKHGLKVYLRDPNAFAPVLGSEQYLLLGSDPEQNRRQIAKFSQRDAEKYEAYEEWMGEIADAVTPLLDNSPINFHNLFCGNVIERLRALKSIGSLIKISSKLKDETGALFELLSAPATKMSCISILFCQG